MSKLDRFKARATKYGVNITIYAFSAEASGDYIDSASGLPDPEDEDYPATIPTPTYAAAVTVKGFVQPATTKEGGEVYVTAPWGEEVRVNLRAFIPGDQDVTEKDKIEVSSVTYWPAAIQEWQISDTVVYREVALVEKVE